jgi:peptide/nickel transport system ATP-binding protein
MTALRVVAGEMAPLLEVVGLCTHFATPEGLVKAVDHVDLTVRRGDIVGLVGESGSGKTMLGLSIIGLVDPPGRIVGGQVRFSGRDLMACTQTDLRKIRGDRISMIFQDPLTTLSPTHRIGQLMMDVIRAHRPVSKQEARLLCRDALGKVGIPSPEERLDAYPHQLSGGMRQRVCIAAAMLNEPDLIIADEPTTALDVTTQAQILAEVRELRDRTGASFIWVTHDLAVVSEIADRVAVMYAGQIVEEGDVETVLARPWHPYTRGLLDSVPSHNRHARRLPQIPGLSPRPGEVITGCRFRPRCSRSDHLCEAAQDLREVERGHAARCAHPLASVGEPRGARA